MQKLRLLVIATLGSVAWGHDIGEPELEKLPIWNKCYGGDCLFQPLQVQAKETNRKITVEIEGVQTSVDQEKFSPVPSDRTWGGNEQNSWMSVWICCVTSLNFMTISTWLAYHDRRAAAPDSNAE